VAQWSMTKAAYWALVLLAMALVLWIRLVPQSLLVTDDWADRIVRRQIYEQVTREVPQHLPPSQRGAQANVLINQWIDQHQAQFKADKAAMSQRLKSQLRYAGNDGQEYVYLGDFDSYLWLRHARNYLRTGTMCDAVVDGACRDIYTNAPVGARTIYARSLHIAAIVGLHTLITHFRPDYPLPASAFLVPVIIGVLGVPPAFFIARRLAGTSGGLLAALLTALHPNLLYRSIGGDNDVWNVVLPLYMMWAAMAAVAAKDVRHQSVYSVLAGMCAGLQAWTWRGWLFSYVVLMAGLVGHGLLHSARYAMQQRTLRVWQAPEVRRTALVLLVFYVVAGLCTTLAGSEEPYLTIPFKALGSVMGSVAGESPASGVEESSWPNTLTTVAELRQPNLSAMARSVGSALFFFGGLVGLLLLRLPKGRWHWWHYAVLLGGMALYGYRLTGGELSRSMTMGLLTAPVAAALFVQLCTDEAPGDAQGGAPLIVVVWFLAAVYTAYGGLRFLLLLVPPFGIACAVTIGRVYAWVRSLVHEAPMWYRAVAHPLLYTVLMLTLLQPLWWGYTTARSYTPAMHDAWWETLTHIRDTAPPDAIVNTWWDYGHWVKYVAERPVSNDGTSLLTHIPHWLGKALVTPSERASVGVLRMLNCGSDATPLPEGTQGAYGKLRDTGRDLVTAYTIVADLVSLDKTAAEAYLTQHGFTASERVSILRSTHCVPPQAYLILSSALLTKRRAWMSLGLWEPRRGDIVERSQVLAQEEAAAESEPETATLYAQARSRTSAEPLERFIAPAQGPLVPQWLPCRAARDTSDMVCEMPVGMAPAASIQQAFVYNPASPQYARLHIRQRQGGELAEVITEGTPAVVILAGAQQIREVPVASPAYPDLGVLVDVPNQRILVGTPPFVRSTFVHLMYLDGRYATHYEKFDDRTDKGERVVTWKINWNGKYSLTTVQP
jgi:hypothetical protein